MTVLQIIAAFLCFIHVTSFTVKLIRNLEIWWVHTLLMAASVVFCIASFTGVDL